MPPGNVGITPAAITGSHELQFRKATRPAIDFEPGSDADFVRLYTTSYTKILKTLVIRLGDIAAAEDCAQDAFESAYRNWKTWKPIAPPEAWVNRIALNAAATYQRKTRLRQEREVIRRIGTAQAATSDPHEITRTIELIDALANLTAKQSAALVLRHYHGYPNRAVADRLGIPERTFASRLASAKSRLRLVLKTAYAETSPRRLPESA